MVAVQSDQITSLAEQLETLDLLTDSQNLNAFLILSGTSSLDGLHHFYDQGGSDALPLWLNTPYMVSITLDHPFIEWLDQQQPAHPDWGVMLLSRFNRDAVFNHFESLTKIYMPDGAEVFFRYWDAPQAQPVLELSADQARTELLGPVEHWLSSQGTLSQPGEARETQQKWPWWQLSETVAAQLFEQNPAVLKRNLLMKLSELDPELYERYSTSVLSMKVERLIAQDQKRKQLTSVAALRNYLQKELRHARSHC